MAMWLEEHWGQASWLLGLVAAAIGWFIRLESRIRGIEMRAEAAKDAVASFEETSKADMINIHKEVSDVYDKLSLIAQTTARIEGYCKARSGGCGRE